jgi:hypothetical protein
MTGLANTRGGYAGGSPADGTGAVASAAESIEGKAADVSGASVRRSVVGATIPSMSSVGAAADVVRDQGEHARTLGGLSVYAKKDAASGGASRRQTGGGHRGANCAGRRVMTA